MPNERPCPSRRACQPQAETIRETAPRAFLVSVWSSTLQVVFKIHWIGNFHSPNGEFKWCFNIEISWVDLYKPQLSHKWVHFPMDSYTLKQFKPMGVHLNFPSDGFVSRMWHSPSPYFVMFSENTTSFSIKGRHCKECIPERANYNSLDCTLSIERGTLKALFAFFLLYYQKNISTIMHFVL